VGRTVPAEQRSLSPRGKHRLYYDCLEYKPLTGTKAAQQKACRFPGSLDTNACSWRRVCLATSEDGLSWVKPKDLGVVQWRAGAGPQPTNGSGSNNIVMEDVSLSAKHHFTLCRAARAKSTCCLSR